MTPQDEPRRLPGGLVVRLSPFGSQLAILMPDQDAWCVRLDTMRGQYRPADEVTHWTRLAPPEQ
jgi:hypothetical protein